jgi:hypothetical protein
MRLVHRWLSLVAALTLIGFVLEMGIANASVSSRESRLIAQPYRAGPLEHREADSAIKWPRGSQELLALGVLAAIVYGFRASGLAGRPERRTEVGVKATGNPKRNSFG